MILFGLIYDFSVYPLRLEDHKRAFRELYAHVREFFIDILPLGILLLFLYDSSSSSLYNWCIEVVINRFDKPLLHQVMKTLK